MAQDEPVAIATDQPVAVAAEDVTVVSQTATIETSDDDMPLPRDPRTIFLGGLFLLALLAALYVAAEIVLPVVLAIVLKLLLQPVVRLLERARVPRPLGALLALLMLVAMMAGLAGALAGPATSWAGKLPGVLPKLNEQLAFLHQPIAFAQRLAAEMEGVAVQSAAPPAAQPQAQAAPHTNLLAMVFSGTTAAAAGLFTTLIVLFYLLVSGETFLRRVVEVLPTFADKRQAVEISLHVERDISAYLLTITLINALVGCATLGVMWACGVDDPLLWGVLAFLLNFIPILGPIGGMVLFAMAGVLSKGVVLTALLPVGLYFAIHVLEGEIATPMLLARRFTINPVAVILALVFWYWMWGVAGAILAVPMLAIVKIVCDDVRPLRALGHFLEG